MKWKNAIELPNNPYSAEALQRRLSQTSHTKFTDIERLTSKFTTPPAINQLETVKSPQSTPIKTHATDKPIKIVVGSSHQVNSDRCVVEIFNVCFCFFFFGENWVRCHLFVCFFFLLIKIYTRYGRDYYINDAKAASGSRALKSSGDLNLHRTIDDDDDDYDSIDNNNNNSNSNQNDNDDDDDFTSRSNRNMDNNNYNTSDSVSDLLDSFNSNRSEQKCRYRYAHMPKLLPKIDVQRLERSQSTCSLQSSNLRNRFNSNATTTSAWALNGHHQYENLPLNRQKCRHQRPTSPSPSLPITLNDHKFYAKGVQTKDNDVRKLEHDFLHREIWRNSLTSRRGTRNFVINPLYNE